VNRFFYSCAALSCLIAVAGCAAVRKVYSEPHIDTVGAEITKDGMFVLPGMKLQMESHNSDEPYAVLWYVVPLLPLPIGRISDHETPGFWVTLVLDPEGEDFSLDLRLVTLELKGEKYFLSSFRGPVGSYGGWRGVCDNPSTSPPRSVKTFFVKPLPVTEWSCFLMKFDSPAPPPEQTFIINVNGIFKAGKPFIVPPLQFQKNTGWRMERVLW